MKKQKEVLIKHEHTIHSQINININALTLWTCYKFGFGFILGVGGGLFLYSIINKIADLILKSI